MTPDTARLIDAHIDRIGADLLAGDGANTLDREALKAALVAAHAAVSHGFSEENMRVIFDAEMMGLDPAQRAPFLAVREGISGFVRGGEAALREVLRDRSPGA